MTGTTPHRRHPPLPGGGQPRPPTRRWAWRTVASPWPNGPRRVPHPLADRVGEPVREVCRGRNGNALLEFEDGSWTIAPWRAAR